MFHRLRFIGLLAALLLFASGCYSRYPRPSAIGVGLFAGYLVVAELEAEAERQARAAAEEPDTQTVVTLNAPYDPPSLPPSKKERIKATNDRSFDAASARAALGAVDLAPCRTAGAPRGYGHAQVTFNPDGKASKVIIDTPDNLPDGAVKCIGDRLGGVTVPEYEGSYITVGTTWFVS